MTQQNIMCAIMALIEEFDEDHLKWLRSEIDIRMKKPAKKEKDKE